MMIVLFSFTMNTNLPAVLLTNGQCYSAILGSNETAYFIVNVPTTAAHATNHLTTFDGAVLLFRGSSSEVAETFAAADPYVRSGLVTHWRVREWTTVIGDGAAAPVSTTS